MNIKEQIKKEDQLVEKLKNPTETHSKEIAIIIDRTIRDGHKVYCATDWHLWTRIEKGKLECKQRKNFSEILKNVNDTMTKDDLLIYLGDLVDGEFQDKDDLRNVLRTLSGKKVLVLGNNDIFPTQFYKSCGFDYVVKSFVWNDVLFTHIPVRNDNQINVHGHIHNYRTYYVPYQNHIDVASLNGRSELVELYKVIKEQPKYAKTIKECPEHFEEGYTPMIETFFECVFNKFTDKFIRDPFPDEE